MSKIKETRETDTPDATLLQFSECIAPFADVVASQAPYALFALGTKLSDDGRGVQTYFNVSGTHDVIAEGLYAELANQIEEGDFTLIALLTAVIADIHEDYELQLGELEDLESGEGDDETAPASTPRQSKTLH